MQLRTDSVQLFLSNMRIVLHEYCRKVQSFTQLSKYYILPAMWFEDSDLSAHSSSSDEDGQRYLENRSRWVSWGQEYDDKLVSAQQYLSIKMTLFLSNPLALNHDTKL